ncbi:DNA repair protein RecN [Hathewaya limosa]|uniref:DNA repair protein RecN n=1 Tax=Hathewaya limosa TaxID=1536 RepID=A0ABU0JRR9_HATLI|nr:DNA repair protein RecN [Hathewaya limosa]MDQ0479792.1 DNA repair protein RecN (Recombination protein N) [Hathewaya limosa]
MLLELNVKDFALIEKLSIKFHEGFNVLLGETGSGKSIIIDAINFLLGGKFNKNFIRTGEGKAFVEGIFTIENIETKKILDDLGIEYEDVLIISRETYKYGKSIAKINGKSVILGSLKEISKTLIDIHGQHENQNLLNNSVHIQYIDYFAKEAIYEVLKEYRIKYYKLKEIEKNMQYLEEKKQDDFRKAEFLKYQLEDIEKANLKAQEEEELLERFKLLNNAEQIENGLSNCYNILYNSNDGYNSVYDSLNLVIKTLSNLEEHNKDIKRIKDSFEEFYYIIEQNVHDLVNIKDNISYDKEELDFINERIYFLDNLKKKYGESIEEILNYKKQIEKEYFDIQNREISIDKLVKEKEHIEEELKLLSNRLHDIRLNISKTLESEIEKEFTYLGLEKVKFKVDIKCLDQFNENGIDKVKFLVSTNPGEPLKSMEEIVSGGELSRIMLSLKSVFINKDNVDSVIFDEIDNGISGRIAQRVGHKMFLISNKKQVFCITHLPQIAAMADYCYVVWKEVINDKTYSNIKLAEEKEKVEFIAKMLGGLETTELSLEHAEELLNIAKESKKKLVS